MYILLPVLQRGGTVLALLGDRQGLERMLHIVRSWTELEEYTGAVQQHLRDLELFQDIMKAVRENADCLQTDLKKLTGETDGHRIRKLTGHLEKHRRLERTREGKKSKLRAVLHKNGIYDQIK